MTWDQALGLSDNTPVKLADGKFGLLIRWWDDNESVGVQVPGEDEIRHIACVDLDITGDGSLTQRDVLGGERVERIDVTTGQPITGEDWAAFDWVDVTTRDRPLGQRFYVRARPRAATP